MVASSDRKIVCIQLAGQLGNHMFQYAAGLSVARAIDAELMVDGNPAALNRFGLDLTAVQVAPPNALIRSMRRLGRTSSAVKLAAPVRRTLPIVEQPWFHYWDGLRAVRASCYLVGFWQSHQYFSPVADQVRAAFDLERGVSRDALGVLAQIAEQPSIGVHVRRGDYTRPEERATRGLCERDYYDRAGALLRRLVPDARFFVFSDDVAAARQELGHWQDALFVEGLSGGDDMFLLSRCQHTIVANSTFSWWAAWLNPNPGKVVVAPRRWLTRERMIQRYVLDLLPDEWVLV